MNSAGASAPTSNIVLVQSVPGTNGTTGTSYATTITSTGSGQCAIVIENDADNPAAPSVPTDAASDTFVQVASGTFSNVANGRLTFFSGNISSGVTSVTAHPTSGHSADNIRIYSGMASGCPADAVVSALTTFSPDTYLTTIPITTTQTDLAVGVCASGSTATAGMSVATNSVWANGKDFPQTPDATDSFAADIVNAVQSQFMFQVSGASHNYACAAVAFKGAVAGSPPSGNSPAFWVNGAGNANSTAATTANMQSGTYGGFKWTQTGSGGQTWTTACHHALLNNVTVNGITYTPGTDPGTTGLSYVMDTNPATAFESFNLPATGVASFVMSGWYFTPTFQLDATRYAPAVIGDVGGTDEVDMGVRLGLIKVESNTNSSAGQAFADGVWGAFSMKYVNGGPFLITLYDASGNSLGQQSATATSTANALTYWLGNQAAFGGINATNQCLSNIEFGGAYPSLP